MRKRFIVLLGTTTKEQNETFLTWAKSEGFGWWHWINGSWLMVDSKGKQSAATLRDKLTEIFPGIYNLVIELQSTDVDTWAGFGPSGEKKSMFKWIKETWRKRS